MADDRATKPKEQAKLMEQKEGKGSDDSPTELASRFKMRELRYQELDLQRHRILLESMEEKDEKRSGDSTAKLAGPSKMRKLRDKELDLQRRMSLLESMEEKDEKRSGDSTAKLAGPSKIRELRDKELDLQIQMNRLEMSKLRYQKFDLQRRRSFLESMEEKGGKRSGRIPAKLAVPSMTKELEGVLLDTRRLTVFDRSSVTTTRRRREGEKSGHNAFLRGDATLEQHVDVEKWMSTDDETHLELRHAIFFRHLISILAPLCPAVEHISIDLHWILEFTLKPIPMKSVTTACIKSLHCSEPLHEALLAVSNFFPNAESLDMQMEDLSCQSNEAYFPEVNSSSSLRELTLRYPYMYPYDVPTDGLLMAISTSCPNIVSLVLSGIGRFLSNKLGQDISSFKLLHLTNIYLEPFRTDDGCRFETLTNVLHEVHVTSPRLKFVEAKKVQLGGAELASVTWSQTSSGCELQLEGASTAVPMADLMHLVSNELVRVTVLTFDRCKVDFPQSTSHPPQSTGEDSSLRELKFLNVECPLSQTDIHKLSEMYPNVKVTVDHESQASHEDFEQGTGMPFKPERKASPSSSPISSFSLPTSSIDELVGATARVHVHKEQTHIQNTEEEEKEEEEEDYIAMESLPHETDEVNVKPIKMECCKRVGVEGGKLQLDSFGIELEIPPGAIDSEVPQDISLRVLTDTQNLGNSKEEMSVCFGVQCLAPDDLVLKLPVTYTIPHCAVITRYSSVKAVLYTGEGEYSPDARVKEQIPLTQSGIPNCKIERDTLRLQMNHFSWAFIRFKLTVFFGGKRMRCLPFTEKPLPEERTTVVLRAHLYDDIKGIYKKIVSQEEGVGFACIHPEAEVLISAAEVDVKMTCFIKRDPIGDTIHTVKYDELCRGHHRTRSFNLDLRSQPDGKIVVTLQVGQTGQSVEELLCIFKFTTPHRSTSLPTHGLEQLQGASSSQTHQASYRSTGETLRNISGRQEDFDVKLTTVARKVGKRDEIDNLGKALGFEPEDIQRYVETNMKNPDVSYMGTLSMLRYWRKKQTEATECKALKGVLEKAGQIYLADKLFGTSRGLKHILFN